MIETLWYNGCGNGDYESPKNESAFASECLHPNGKVMDGDTAT